MLNVVLSVPVALRVRLMQQQRLLTTILVIPITLGTVMVAEGLLTYLGPRGWLNRTLLEFGLADSPVRLIHNYWGVMLSLVITGFPFTFLLTLSYVTGIDPALEQAGAMLGARRARAVPAHPAAAAGAGPRHHPGARLRAGVHRVPLGDPAGRAGRADARDLDRRLSGGVRAVRLLAGLGDRDADGGGAGADHRGAAGRRGAWCSAARPAPARAEPRCGARIGERLWAFAVWALVGFFVAQPAGDDRQRGGELVRHALVQHLAAGRLHAAMVCAGLERVPACRTSCWSRPRWSARWCCCPALIGVPAAYAMARRNFPGKQAVMLLFLLPLLVPPITYGIPLATVLYQAHLAGTIWGVILANLVPTVPFVILIMIPFVEQIDPRVEAAARVFGAGMRPAVRAGAGAAADARHPRRAAAGAGAHHRDVRADLPDLGPDQPDAGGGAVLRGVRRGRAAGTVDRRDGGGLHGHHAGLAADRAALRQPDADRDAGEALNPLGYDANKA